MTVFADRAEAGKQLARALRARDIRPTAVLGLAKGGVPVAYEVAKAFEVPLDVLVVRKIRAKYVPELALGSVCADGSRALRRRIVEEAQPNSDYLEEETRARATEAAHMEEGLRRPHAPVKIAGQVVCIVDDGAATGATMEAAVLSTKQRGASTVIVAIPVGSVSACMTLESVADEVFSLMTPVNFFAVGQYYETFDEVTEEAMETLLASMYAQPAAV